MKFPLSIRLNFNLYNIFLNKFFIKLYWTLSYNNVINLFQASLKSTLFSVIWQKKNKVTVVCLRPAHSTLILIKHTVIQQQSNIFGCFVLRSLWSNEHKTLLTTVPKSHQVKLVNIQSNLYLNFYLQNYWILNFLLKQSFFSISQLLTLPNFLSSRNAPKSGVALSFWHKLLLTKI
mgnify:FL=1